MFSGVKIRLRARRQLAGGQEVAETMVNNWVAAFRANLGQDFEYDNFFNRSLHPLIKAEFDLAKTQAQAKTTVYEACAYVAKNSG